MTIQPSPGALPGPYEDEVSAHGTLVPVGDVQIDRFDLPPNEREVEVLTRYGTRFLPHVEASDRVPGGYTLWGLVPQRTPYGKRYARVLAAGDSVPTAALADHEYVGTFHDLGHVWHVFITKEGAR